MILSAPATILTGLVTLLAVLITQGTSILVSRVRRRVGIAPPAMSGSPDLDCAVRVHANTIEQIVLFLPALWLATLYFQGWIAPILGAIWCLGRIIYAVSYKPSAPGNRFAGFALTIFPPLILIGLAAFGLVTAWMASTAA